jgi:hypothetical protein
MFEDRTIIGLVEEITLYGRTKEFSLKARVDSGATRSSIDESIAEKIGASDAGATIVKSSHGMTKRKLVEATLTLGGKKICETFTVINRKHMTYPVLIGQNILKHGFLIDPKKV